MVQHNSFIRNTCNFVLLIAVALPSLAFYYFIVDNCSPQNKVDDGNFGVQSLLVSSFRIINPVNENTLCQWALKQPIIVVNVIVFLNVCVLFWIISLLQQSTWVLKKQKAKHTFYNFFSFSFFFFFYHIINIIIIHKHFIFFLLS